MPEPQVAAPAQSAAEVTPQIDINAVLTGTDATVAAPSGEVGADESDDLSDLLAEELDLTPEQLQAAVKRIRANAEKTQKLRTDAHKIWGTSEKRAKKLEKREAEIRHNQQVFEAQARQFNAAFSALRTGDAKTTLEGLRQLTGRDPIKVLEDLNVHIASNGKKRELTPEEIELKERIDRLEQTRQLETEQAEYNRAAQFVEQRKQQLAQGAITGEEQFPALADYAKDNQRQVGEALAELIVSAAREGRKLTDAEAMGMLDKHLDELSQRTLRRKNGTTDSGSENGTGIPGQKPKPGTAQAPVGKGKSLSVSAATAASVKRDLTEEELAEDAANFLPSSLVSWARGMNGA
jgi:hypothetical protein